MIGCKLEKKYDMIKLFPEEKTNDLDTIDLYCNSLIRQLKPNISKELIHNILKKNKRKSDDIIKILEIKINKYFEDLSRNIKRCIKKSDYSLYEGFIPGIKNSILFLQSVNRTFYSLNKKYDNYTKKETNVKLAWGKSIVIYIGIKSLSKKVMSNQLIISYLKNNFKNLKEENKVIIKDFYFLMKKLKGYDENLFYWFIRLIDDSIKCVDKVEPNSVYINKKIGKILLLKKNIDQIFFLRSYFDFAKYDISKIIDSIASKCIQKIYSIINDNINDTNFIFSFLKESQVMINNFINVLKYYNLEKTMDEEFLTYIIKIMSNIIENINTFQEIENFMLIYNFSKKNIYYSKNLKPLFEESMILLFKDRTDNFVKYFVQYIDYKIINKINFDSTIIEIIKLQSEKDRFSQIYRKYLKNRLLSKNTDMNFEIKIYELLLKVFSTNYTIGIKRMVNDKEISDSDNCNFNSIKIENVHGGKYKEDDLDIKKMYVLTLSLNVWDINFKMGNMSSKNIQQELIPYKFYIYMKSYNEFYKKTYDNKRDLIWYLHMGEIVMSNIYKGKKIIIKLLPIQAIILNILDTYKDWSEKYLLNLVFWSNYDKQFKLNIIKSLLNVNLIVKSNDYDEVNYSANSFWKPNKNEYDLISIFHELSKYEEIIEKKEKQELVMDRKIVVSSLINHIVKKEKDLTMNINKLKLMTKKSCSNFPCDDKLFNSSIQSMIKKDLISFKDENSVIKLIY